MEENQIEKLQMPKQDTVARLMEAGASTKRQEPNASRVLFLQPLPHGLTKRPHSRKSGSRYARRLRLDAKAWP